MKAGLAARLIESGFGVATVFSSKRKRNTHMSHFDPFQTLRSKSEPAKTSNRILVITWNIAGLSNNSSIPTAVEKLNTDKLPVVLCLQESSTPLKDDDQSGSCSIKVGRVTWEGRGTNKNESDNQRCNTIIYWSKEFKYESRDSAYHGNRFYECVKLSLNGVAFWVLCVHGPSMGPQGYNLNGNSLGTYFQKMSEEKKPLIVVGDMNCQPKNMDAGKEATVVSSGNPTRTKSQTELDFMVVFRAKAKFHLTDDVRNTSDHIAVSFIVELGGSGGSFGFDPYEKTGNPFDH